MELQVYKNAEFGSVRTTTIGGQPYFVGKDVAGILGYANTRKALIDHIDEEDKDDVTIRDAIGRNQTMTAINESGLYSLILSSKMPNAKKFKRWVTNEVLPAIRKHGLYVTDDLIADPDLAIAAFTALKEEREKNKELMAAVAIGQQQIAEMKPKATYYDVVLKCRDAVNISVIAKDYGWSAMRMNEYLHEKGIQFKQGDIWLLYQKYAPNGYTKTNTHIYEDSKGIQHTKVHTKWTQKGRLFIYEQLKADGIYPQIEMEV
ncbi:Prophage antirepressor [Listeria monocytogenes]|uniref:phage antirepressor KilAC domain-containing protein n=1 Tax=Listeria monocytogenes TaxID=1639 RepID=UPI00074D6805|nr:phage antirepressor [Listeria monocytogenes]EAE7887173.1 phage antirepressor [Listeria monocytogenes]ECC0657000.1 phage antirepressor [Listeria monocytogenes]EJQ6756019.1 phage antirepressor [Listeria monocytogenes]MDJ1536058.1 phage antirepressor [Listeria monocytogenes]NJA47706.1 phage antirepressor [Listeria monocytogenes]